MPEYSMVETAIQLGAISSQVVDLATGEILSPGGGGPRAGGTLSGGRRVGGGAAASGGLSNPHICTREGKITAWAAGTLVKVTRPQLTEREQVGGGKRGKVTQFTAASRRRMLYTVGKIQRAKLPVMVTLTYPSQFPTEGVIWKNHLRRWWQRLKRRLPLSGGIWKLEPQKRGAPHFHLLIWGVAGVPLHEFMCWVSRSWYQVVGSGDVKHLAAGTRVEQIRDRRGVLAYATKYLGKVVVPGLDPEESGWDEPGRFWGIKSADCIPWAECIEMSADVPVINTFFRYMRRYAHLKARSTPSQTILCGDPWQWLEAACTT